MTEDRPLAPDAPEAESGEACPICGRPVEAGAPHRPFCCERCKMVDLGRWFQGTYAIPGEDAFSFGNGEEHGSER